MGGLVAAARARELGLRPVVLEAGSRPGGSLLLSSGVVWRHHDVEAFRQECPRGDEALQRVIVERVDDALAWLRTQGAPVVSAATGNPHTTGVRFDPAGLIRSLARRLDVRFGEPVRTLAEPTVLATGGFGTRLARERALLLRASPWSEGDGIALGRAAGGAMRGDPDEFYGRALPAPPAVVGESDFVRAAQVYGGRAYVVDLAGRPVGPADPAWHEVDLAQAIAVRPGGEAWFVVDAAAMGATVSGGSVRAMVAVAEELGGEVRSAATLEDLGLGPLASPRLVEAPFVAVRVGVGVTHTYAGLAVDANARVLNEAGSPVPGLWACGADAGGLFGGGYASGLAAALVLGLAAAEDAAASL
jgi:succinate dehydrogenase/fumarate reductase flavoprotein subunit